MTVRFRADDVEAPVASYGALAQVLAAGGRACRQPIEGPAGARCPGDAASGHPVGLVDALGSMALHR